MLTGIHDGGNGRTLCNPCRGTTVEPKSVRMRTHEDEEDGDEDVGGIGDELSRAEDDCYDDDEDRGDEVSESGDERAWAYNNGNDDDVDSDDG